jgi:hypothetical protein
VKSSASRRDLGADGEQSAVRFPIKMIHKIAPRASARSALRLLCQTATAMIPANESARIIAASLGARGKKGRGACLPILSPRFLWCRR